MGTLTKESVRSSSSDRSKIRLRNKGCPCIFSTITGLPVANTCPVSIMRTLPSGCTPSTGPGRSVGQTKPEQTGFRFKKHQMSAQKIVPGGEHTQ